MSAATTFRYLNPLPGATIGRTDQGVDATLPAGGAIRAPGKIKILGVEPDWYQSQPLIYWQLLSGPDAGKDQYVAEQINHLAPVGSVLAPGQTIANYAPSGTGIEYGWATPTGQTLAAATSGYSEGQVTPAGSAMSRWLSGLTSGSSSPSQASASSTSTPSAEQLLTNPVGAAEAYAAPRLGQGALYFALIVGGAALAVYGLVQMVKPTGISQTVRRARGVEAA